MTDYTDQPEGELVDPAEAGETDPTRLALLRNDLRGMTAPQRATVISTLVSRMGIDPALAPIDLIADKKSGALRPYINARGAAELDKRHSLNDEDLRIDIRERVVIAHMVKTTEDGRAKRDVGASAYDPERPDTLARAVKTATTSAHRRTTLRMVGIFLNEPEQAPADG